MAKTKTWKCICGKVHNIDGKPIYCVGPGHSVYFNPAYWNYKAKPEDKQEFQLTLL